MIAQRFGTRRQRRISRGRAAPSADKRAFKEAWRDSLPEALVSWALYAASTRRSGRWNLLQQPHRVASRKAENAKATAASLRPEVTR